MNSDFYFNIGKSHTVCQDYALAATSEDGGEAVFLSDGCSSSPHTDFGARFICTAAAQQWKTEGLKDAYPTILRAFAMSQMAGLPPDCLDATLLAAFPQQAGVRVRAWGDGVIAARERGSGRIFRMAIQAPKGAPDYPSYLLDRDRMGNYFRYTKDAGKFLHRSYGTADVVETREGSVFEGVSVYFPAATYDLVSIMSDGAQSFQQKDERGGLHTIPVEDVVAHVMNIRGNVGEFIVRTVRNVFLNRHCPQNNWTHYDDFTVASIFIPAPAEEAT